jgi:hypothetical protein
MRSSFTDDLLADLHQSIDRVVQALVTAHHPQLAAAMRAHATGLPPPPPTGVAMRPRRSLEPLAYRALDLGLLDAAELDRLLLRYRRAKAVLYSDGSPSCSLSSAGSTTVGGPSRRGASACR